MHGQDLTLGALELLLATHVVPELGLGAHLVASEHSQCQHLGCLVLLRGVPAAQHDVLPDLGYANSTFICSDGSVGSWADFLAIFTILYYMDANIILNISEFLLKPPLGAPKGSARAIGAAREFREF